MKKHTILICFILLCILSAGCGTSPQPAVLHVAIPYSDKVQDPDTNYYISYLEEKTGLSLDITLIRQELSEEYLDALFASDADIDIVLFGEDFLLSEEALSKYESSGDVYASYMNTGNGIKNGAGQILWINQEWLSKLGLPIPVTTDEFMTVLKAFSENDLNGNGLPDEIALAGCCDDPASYPVEFLLNSFIYNDPYHSRYGINEDSGKLMAAGDTFRDGLIFCNTLYEEGLLDKRIYICDHHSFCELVNSPLPLVGAFTTGSISDVIYQANPEILARYMHVTPLIGPGGECHALYKDQEPSIGAVITGRSRKKNEASLLLDTMLSEEASLIARFGEKGVDWDFSDGADVSIYGSAATIVTHNYIWNTVQNKHLNGIGPMDLPEKYVAGVTWNGINSDAEYIDGRAQMSYKDYLPSVNNFHEYDPALSEYINEYIKAFVRGDKDIRSDEEWNTYLKGLEQYY